MFVNEIIILGIVYGCPITTIQNTIQNLSYASSSKFVVTKIEDPFSSHHFHKDFKNKELIFKGFC